MKIIRLVLTIIAITYFVGQYWFIIVQMLCLSDIESGERHDYHLGHRLSGYSNFYSFLKNDDWDLTKQDGIQQVINSMYFALTTLSTTGFGDLYPKTDKERLISTVVLLSGVSVMSYVLSELRYMVANIKILHGDIDEKE